MAFVDVAGLSGTVQEKIYEDAKRLDREANVVKPLVEFMSDLSDMRPRQYNMRPKLKAQKLGEYDDLANAQPFDNIPGNIITPIRVGGQYLVTDPRIAQDPKVQAAAAAELAEGLMLEDENDLLACVANLGRTIGDGSAATSLTNIRTAVSWLNTKGGRMKDKIVVLDEWQWFPIAAQLDATATPTNVSERIKDSVQGAWYITTIGMNTHVFVTSNTVKTGADSTLAAKGGVFLRDAIGYDERKAPHGETERDASRQATEMNLHSWRGIGLWAPDRGITLHGKITEPDLPSDLD